MSEDQEHEKNQSDTVNDGENGDAQNNEQANTDSDQSSDGDEHQSSDSDSQSPSDTNSSTPDDLPPIETNYQSDVLNDFVRSALTPISNAQPCGENEEESNSVISQIETTSDSIHEALRLAFGEAVREDNMTMFELSSDGRAADGLAEQIIECLQNRCKSLVLASYLPHLLLIGHGPEGFSAGLFIFSELIQRFPDRVFPRDTEKLSGFLRRGVYIGNDDKVTDNFKLFLYLPITEAKTLPYALLRNSKLKAANPEVEGRYAADAAASSPQFYVKLVEGLQGVIASAKEANASIRDLLGDELFEIVNFSFVESLERMVSITHRLATDNCAGYPPVEELDAVMDDPSNQSAPAATGEIVSREQAIELLQRIGDFFHRTERHSPISYRIRDTIRWCNMDLPELMQELLDGDEGPLTEMRKRVGFREASSSEYDE